MRWLKVNICRKHRSGSVLSNVLVHITYWITMVNQDSTVRKHCDCCSYLKACQILSIFFGIVRITLAVLMWYAIQGNILLREDDFIFVVLEISEFLLFVGDVLLWMGSTNKISMILTTWKSWNTFLFGAFAIGLMIKIVVRSRFPHNLFFLFAVQGLLFLWGLYVMKKALKEIENESWTLFILLLTSCH